MFGMVWHKGYTREQALQSVGSGWTSLINKLFDKYETIKGTVKIIQVKEKWGGLRIYTDSYNDELEKFILQISKESFTICEVCGKPGQLRTDSSWHRTLCNIHHTVRDIYFK